MKHAFVGFINGAESEPVSNGEMVIYSDGESSIGETESLYQLQDGRFGGCFDGDSIPDPLEPPNRVAIFMAGTQPTLQSSTTVALISGAAAGAGGPARWPAQLSTGTRSPLEEFMSSLARSANWGLGWTSAPTSLRWLSVHDPPRFSPP